MSQDDPRETADETDPSRDGEAEREWSNRHWRRIKRLLGATAVTFLFVAVALAVENPPDSDPSFETAPVSFMLTAVFALLLVAIPWYLPYLISKDKATLQPYFEGVTRRPWYIVFLLNAVTAGLYAPWYLYVRWRRLPGRRLANPTTPDSGEREGRSPGERGYISALLEGIENAVAVSERALRSMSAAVADKANAEGSATSDVADRPATDGEVDRPATDGDIVDAHLLASRATGTVSERRLTEKRRALNLWLFDDPPVAYLEPDEQPEFLLRHTNKGLKVTDPGGSSQRLDTRLSAGEKYLLVTDQRLVYLAGSLLSDDTLRSFRYEDLESVEADAGFTGGKLRFRDRDGVEYVFPTAMFLGAGLSLQSGELRRASEYVDSQIRDVRTDDTETSDGAPAPETTSSDSMESDESEEMDAAAGDSGDSDDTEARVTGDEEEPDSQRRAVQDAIRPLESTLDATEDHLENGDIQAARAKLRGLEDEIDAADDLAAANDFSEARDGIARLEERRRTYLQRLNERTDERDGDRDGLKAPDQIPQAPDIAVTYDGLTDEGPIGSGGNADVTKATLSTSDGDVTLAIKKPRMSGTLHTETIERLLEEAETWDRIDDHDHIVSVVDYGSDPLPWIAMEYMDAGDLSERAGALELDQALWTAISITEAVHHAHRRGVAHLDLKPQNVLFRSAEGAWDVPKVADWGLSKHLLRHSKSVEGLSPQYAAPEQFDDGLGPTDDITDVYQLGAVFYELFTGEPVFDGQPATVMHKALHEDPTPPSELADVPPALDDALLRALAVDRTDRYETVLYLRDALADLSTEQ